MAGEIVKVTDNHIVYTLSNSEIILEFPIVPRVFQIQNMGSSIIYASLYPGISDRIASTPAIDVTAVLPGSSVIIENRYIETNTAIYLAGEGQVQVTATDIVTSLYTGARTSSGGGSGSGEDNVIEIVKVNGERLSVGLDKSVNIAVPVKVSELENDTGYIDVVPDIYATKTYVGDQIANIDKLTYSIVEELPADAEASENIIYMIHVANVSGNDKYEEYMKIDGTLQLIGDTSVDLSGYAKVTDIPSSLPANGGNADTVGGHTVNADVPENAVFTDTVYTLPTATTDTLGGVKVDGTTITADENGVISVVSGTGSGEENVIESIKVNGVEQDVNDDKSVNITVPSQPTKVSELENDSGYLTEIPQEYVTETELNEKGYLTAVPDSYATKTYVGEQIANTGHLTRSIVTALPTDDEARENVIYMLKADGVTGEDKYREYMKIDGTVQLVGDTSVDLSNYAKIADIPTSLPANGGNADTVNGHTVNADVPSDAVFTDTVYTLPAATSDTLGGVKVDGTTITADENGVISAVGGGSGYSIQTRMPFANHFKLI